MASPQKENGYTPISNELLEALSTVRMSGTEWQFVMCLVRKTYGFQKKEDWITNSQICEMVCLPKERVSEAKKKLLARKIVTEKRNKISLQKDYEKWVELRKSVTTVTEKRNKLLRKSVNTKEKKETIQKSPAKAENNMSWNKKSDDYEEGVVDLDTGVLSDLVAEQKTKDKEQAARFRKAVDWLVDHQGRNPTRTSVPRQLAAIKKLSTMGVGAKEAKRIILECEASPYWKGREEKPDYWTVVTTIQNRG